MLFGFCISVKKCISAMAFPDFQCLQRQADEASADAQFDYGVILFEGNGIPIDKSLAAH
jgi:TPR repeat protein